MKTWLQNLFQSLWINRGLLSRAILCWLIGAITFWSTQVERHDWRLRIRNQQPSEPKIILIHFNDSDWNYLLKKFNEKRTLSELFISQSDEFFWNPKIWNSVLQRVLQDTPSVIGVNLIFSDTETHPLTRSEKKTFTNPKVVWAATLDSQQSPIIPYFVDPISQRQALIDLNQSDNGIVRLSPSNTYPLAHMGETLALAANPKLSLPTDKNHFVINFSGPEDAYRSVNIKQIIDGKLPKDFFRDKIVLIGTKDIRLHRFLTPIGLMDQSEIIANSIDTILNKKFIIQIPISVYLAILFFIVLLSTLICIKYPHELSGILLTVFAVAITSLSFWLFDRHYFWFPILSPVTTIISCFILFLSMQLTLKENQNWRLEQEKKYLFEVRQLKENFVSLISHDLKTPIAKLQAIIDRMKQEHTDPKLENDLALLRKESTELNRYIQSILKILRVEAQDFKLNKDVCDINKIIELVTQQLRPLAKAKSVSIETELEPMFTADLDSTLIREVILNLIENAIKYSKENSTVRVLSTEVDDQVIVVVEDGGSGISKEEQNKIFDKFHRGKEHSFSTKGSGLGLYLVKYFIELHGGEVFLESEVGKGTTVGFSLPLNEQVEPVALET